MERFNQQNFDNYWQEFSKSYSDEDCYTENNFNCAFYCDILILLENSKEEAKKHGVDVKYIKKLYEESKMPEEEQKEDPKEASERAWYEVDKRALEDIIYDSKFLKKRKDIDEIWVKVSKELFKSKFPQISNPLMQTVRKYYESDDGLKLSYYNDYVNTYTLALDKEDKNIIHVVQDVSFTLNVEDKEKFPFPMTMWTCASPENKDKATLLCENVTVNGKPATAEVSEPKYEEGTLRYDYKLQLEGNTEYKIKQRITKKYNLKEDNFIGYKARWLVNGIRVKVFHPKELGILFVNRGVMGEFSKEEREDFKEYEFKGLILKHQGYILTIIPKGN